MVWHRQTLGVRNHYEEGHLEQTALSKERCLDFISQLLTEKKSWRWWIMIMCGQVETGVRNFSLEEFTLHAFSYNVTNTSCWHFHERAWITDKDCRLYMSQIFWAVRSLFLLHVLEWNININVCCHISSVSFRTVTYLMSNSWWHWLTGSFQPVMLLSGDTVHIQTTLEIE